VLQFIGVGAAGVISLVVDAGTLWLLSAVLGVEAWIGAAAGFTLGGLLNFALNRRVFDARDGDTRHQGVKYLTLFGVNLVITTLTVPALAEVAERLLDPVTDSYGTALLVAKLAVMAVLMVSNTVVYRTWVFAAPADES
jgi:putative flippase GtrA